MKHTRVYMRAKRQRLVRKHFDRMRSNASAIVFFADDEVLGVAEFASLLQKRLQISVSLSVVKLDCYQLGLRKAPKTLRRLGTGRLA